MGLNSGFKGLMLPAALWSWDRLRR